MKLLLVSDGRYPEYVNGVSIYLHYLAREVIRAGHEVGILHVKNSRFFGKPSFVRTIEDGIHYFGVTNSPLFMGNSLENPRGNLSEPQSERLFKRILDDFIPTLVHFHEFHRMPASTIEIAKKRGLAVLVTVHDYWFICPLFQLFTPQETLCSGPEGGLNCVTRCLSGDRIIRVYRRLIRTTGHTASGKFLKLLRNVYKRVHGEPLWQTTRGNRVKRNPQNLRLKDQITKLGEREKKLKELLIKSDAIHAVSRAAARVHVNQGVPEEMIKVIQLGVRATDWLKPRVKRLERPPLKVGFLGHLGPSKGVQVLLEAAKNFPNNEAQFHIFGKGRTEDILYVHERASSGGRVFYHGPYDYKKLQAVFDQIHVLVIPSLWEETLGLIGLEAQAAGVPVIASALGGMLDYVEDGINGRLFPPGDADYLIRCLGNTLQQPSLLEEMSIRAVSPKTMVTHVQEIIGLYKGVPGSG